MLRSYDIIVNFHIDATFSPLEVAAIDSIRATAIEVSRNGQAVPSNIKQTEFPFEGLERGPGSVELVIPNKMPLLDAQGFYSIQVSVCNSSIIATSWIKYSLVPRLHPTFQC